MLAIPLTPETPTFPGSLDLPLSCETARADEFNPTYPSVTQTPAKVKKIYTLALARPGLNLASGEFPGPGQSTGGKLALLLEFVLSLAAAAIQSGGSPAAGMASRVQRQLR